MHSATPNLDAVAAWIAGGRTGPIEWPAPRFPNPFAKDMTMDERVAYTIAHCASGAPAELGPPAKMINGKLVPPPPGRRRWKSKQRKDT